MKKINCRKCGHCRRLYRLCLYNYYKNNVFYCTLKGTYTEPDGSCPEAKIKKPLHDFSAQRFDSVIKDIEFLIDKLS